MKYAMIVILGCVLAVAEGKDVICSKCLGCAQSDYPSTWCPDINRDGLVDHEDLIAVAVPALNQVINEDIKFLPSYAAGAML